MTHDGSGIGQVVLVGGGPGDADLVTVAALREIRAAEVILYDRLAPLSVLDEAPAGCELIEVGKIPRGEFTPQETINALLVEHARAGRRVVRLKGGDPYVFGRGGEEALACQEAGVPVREIPGISSSVAAAAAVGIPVTHRGLAQGFTVVSGHLPPGHPGSDVDWVALARSGTTLVVMMGVLRLPEICAALLEAGMPTDTPAATVENAALPEQRVIRGTVADLAEKCVQAGIQPPATTVIGAVAELDLHTAASPHPDHTLGQLPLGDRELPVQRASAEDLPALIALLRDDPLGAGRESTDLGAYQRAFAAIDRDPAQTLIVVREAGAVVATLQLTLIPNLSRGGALRAQLEGVRVAATHRGTGLGSALLAWTEAYAAARGATLAQLTSDATRTDARRFYERRGWTASHLGLKKPLTPSQPN